MYEGSEWSILLNRGFSDFDNGDGSWDIELNRADQVTLRDNDGATIRDDEGEGNFVIAD